MKKYQIIGFILWTLGNIILTLRMWDYILIAPILAVQVVIWICCVILFYIDILSKGLLKAGEEKRLSLHFDSAEIEYLK